MNNLSPPASITDPIPLDAVLDGSAVSRVDPALVQQLEQDRKTADTSTLSRMIALALILPIGFVFLVLAFVLGPKLILKLGSATVFVNLAKTVGLTGQFLANILVAKKTGKAIVTGLILVISSFAIAPVIGHRRRLRRQILEPLVQRIEGLSFAAPKDLEQNLGSSIQSLLRQTQFRRGLEMTTPDWSQAVSLKMNQLTVFFVPIEFSKFSIFQKRPRVTFTGTAILTRFPDDAANKALHIDWRSARLDRKSVRSPSYVPMTQATMAWRRDLINSLMESVGFCDIDMTKYGWERHGMAFREGRLVLLTARLPTLDHKMLGGTRPIGDVLSRFFDGVRRIAEASAALERCVTVDAGHTALSTDQTTEITDKNAPAL
ncbi:MAG: hypothetical protein ACMVO3_25540 [Thalassobaculum sp.]